VVVVEPNPHFSYLPIVFVDETRKAVSVLHRNMVHHFGENEHVQRMETGRREEINENAIF